MTKNVRHVFNFTAMFVDFIGFVKLFLLIEYSTCHYRSKIN